VGYPFRRNPAAKAKSGLSITANWAVTKVWGSTADVSSLCGLSVSFREGLNV